MCNNSQKGLSLCQNFKVWHSLGVVSALRNYTDFIGGFIGEMPTKVANIVLYTLDCVFDTTDDATIAESFNFILFKP